MVQIAKRVKLLLKQAKGGQADEQEFVHALRLVIEEAEKGESVELFFAELVAKNEADEA